MAEKQRLAEALRANLRRRKVARGARTGDKPAEHETAALDEAATGGPRDAPVDQLE